MIKPKPESAYEAHGEAMRTRMAEISSRAGRCLVQD